MTDAGWRPLGEPPARRARGAPAPGRRPPIGRLSAFTRLARTHAAMAAGDTVVAVALAGSVFFNTDLGAARWRVALFLVLTMAPFAVLAPLVAPAIDKMPGGRRLTMALLALGRALVSVAMIAHIDSVLLFPEALISLVLSKAYLVSKSALVPSVVNDESELVEANAKLGVISGVVGFAAAVPAVILQQFGSSWTVGFSSLVFAAAAVLALALPRQVVASTPAAADERAELRAASVVLSASAMALLRASVGFLTFLLAFSLRTAKAGPGWFALMLIATALGTLAGNAAGPRLRERWREESMIVGALGLTTLGAALAAFFGGRMSAALAALLIGFSAALGRLAFDSIVQRDAPEANRGRAFAQFETRFQLAWVGAAFVPVIITLPPRLGFSLLALLGAFGVVSFLAGTNHLRRRGTLPPSLGSRAGKELRRRRAARRRPVNR